MHVSRRGIALHTLQCTILCKEEQIELYEVFVTYKNVTGSEKRGHFAQNANFYHFSNCHHTKAFRTLGFPLALQTL